MSYSIRKTENGYDIDIEKNEQKVTLSEKEFIDIMESYKRETRIQDMVRFLEHKNKYIPELFANLQLWNAMQMTLEHEFQKEMHKITDMSDESTHLFYAIRETYKKYKKELKEYESSKKTNP